MNRETSLKAYVKSKEEQLIVPTYTTKITDDNIHLPGFEWLNNEYKTPGSSISNALLSLANALITQRRLVFAYSRNSAQELMRNDKNYKKAEQVAFGNSKWTSVIKLMTETDSWFELIQQGEGNAPAVFKIKSNFLRSFIVVDEAQQLEETLKFVSQYKSKNSLQDSNRDREQDRASGVVGSIKNIVCSEEKKTALQEPLAVATALKTQQAAPSVVTSGESNNPKEMETTQQNPRCAAPLKSDSSDVESLESAAASVQTEWERTFIADCRAALNKFGSLTEGKRNKLSEIALKPKPDTRPVIQKSQLINILQIPKISADKQLKVIKEYRLPSEPAHLQQLTNIIVHLSPDTAKTLVNGLGLTLSDTQLGTLRVREKRNSDRLKLETELSTVTSKEELEAMGAVEKAPGLYVLKGHHVDFYDKKARLV